MIHRQAIHGYWGVNKNAPADSILVVAGDDTDQVRIRLSVEQAEEMVTEMKRQIQQVKFLTEARGLEAKWDINLLKDVVENSRKEMAPLLEGERLSNERSFTDKQGED